MAKLVDASDLNSDDYYNRAGSIPAPSTDRPLILRLAVGFIFTDHNLTSYRERYVFDRVSTFKRLPTVR